MAAGIKIQRRDGLQPLQQRLAVPDVRQQEPLIRQPGPVDQVGAAAHRDVVAEPPRVFVRIGVTSDPHDQRRVVDAVALSARQAQPIGQPRRDQRRPQHVFGRLAEAEVDGHRQRRQNFCSGRHRASRKSRDDSAPWRSPSQRKVQDGHFDAVRGRTGRSGPGPPRRCLVGGAGSRRVPCTGNGPTRPRSSFRSIAVESATAHTRLGAIRKS